MKPRRNRNVSPKFTDDIGKQKAATASAYSLSDKGDMTLVAAAKNENRQAFEILVERHARRVFFTARRMTRTREDAEDVVQQSLQKAFVHLDQFEGKSSFSTWLTRIAINEALILLRKTLDLRAAESHEQELGHGQGRRRLARGGGLRGHGAALDDDHQEERRHRRHPRDAERRAEPHAIARERARIAPKGMAKS